MLFCFSLFLHPVYFLSSPESVVFLHLLEFVVFESDAFLIFPLDFSNFDFILRLHQSEGVAPLVFVSLDLVSELVDVLLPDEAGLLDLSHSCCYLIFILCFSDLAFS